MDVIVTGLDRYKIVELAKVYNIDMSRYMFALDMFENEIVLAFNRKKKK